MWSAGGTVVCCSFSASWRSLTVRRSPTSYVKCFVQTPRASSLHMRSGFACQKRVLRSAERMFATAVDPTNSIRGSRCTSRTVTRWSMLGRVSSQRASVATSTSMPMPGPSTIRSDCFVQRQKRRLGEIPGWLNMRPSDSPLVCSGC